MEQQIIPFNHPEFGAVRIIQIDKEPWFVAKDVALALGYKDPKKAIKAHCKKAKVIDDFTEGAFRPLQHLTKIIPESDFYRLTLKSNMPSAEKFQDWVVEEVLPTIRKTGSYNIKPSSKQSLQDERLINFLRLTKESNLVGDTFIEHALTHKLAELNGTVAVIEDRIIDVSTFLQGKGFSAKQLRTQATRFGKALKKAYILKYNEMPEKALRFVNGAERPVYLYTEKNIPLLEEVFQDIYDEDIF